MSARSKIFYNMFTSSNVSELVVQDEPYDAWKKLLEYIYSDAVELSAGVVNNLIKLAVKYQFHQLEA